MIEKLVIYDYPLTRPVYYTESRYNDNATGKSWCGISPEKAAQLPVKESYEGAAAIRKLWEINFDNLSDTDKKLIRAVYPNADKKDETTLKHRPTEILKAATIKARKIFGVTCPRCGGSGNYARAVAYTEVDNGVCPRCGGSGKVLPRLTDKKLAEITKCYTEAAE